jgi:lauroyl/myristoyl acyltransferase
MKWLWGHFFGRIGLSRFLQWRVNTFLARWLPLAAVRAYIYLLGKLYFFLNSREREDIQRNLRTILPRLNGNKPLESIIRRTFTGIYSHYYEKLFIAYTRFSKVCSFLNERVQLEGQQLLDDALAQGRGVLLVTGHFGAVEYLPLTLALKGYPVTMVVRFKTERLKRALNERTAYVPITLLDAGDGEEVIFRALQALRSNQILITECDEFDAWRPHRSRRTHFLGCSTAVDRSLDLLQRRNKSPVIMGLVCRERGNRFGLKLHSLLGNQQNPAATNISQRALQVLEHYISLTPDQWYQWKEVRTLLGTSIYQETMPIHAAEADQLLPVADSVMHAHQA